MRDRRMWRLVGRGAVLAAELMLLLAACIGSVSQDGFDEERRSRGGGLDQQLVVEAVEALDRELDGAPIELDNVNIAPDYVSLTVRVPGSDGDLDVYTYRGGELSGPEPLPRSSGEAPLDPELLTPEQAGIPGFDQMVDTALADADLDGGWSEQAQIHRIPPEPQPQVVITVQNERWTVTVTLAPDGSVLGVTR